MVYARKRSNVVHEEWCPYVRRIKKRASISDSRSKELGMCECKFCRSVKGLVYKYRKQPLIGMECFYDPVDNAICFKTKIGFWKIIWKNKDKTWRLFHLNNQEFLKGGSANDMMRRSFHRQGDVPAGCSILKITNYIHDHDRNLAHTSGDYRKMPRATKKQQQYYNQAKKKAKRKSIRNVYKILDKIKMEGELRHG